MNSIFTRRSIRKYEDKLVSDAMIKDLIHAGMCAPSATNQQPWQFIVIDNRALLDKIPSIQPYSKMLHEVHHTIIVCGDLSLVRAKDFWVQDCSAATQNILLMATSLDLASVWLGCYPNENVVNGLQQLLNLPEHIIPFSILPIGYGAEEKAPNSRNVDERIHYNTW